MYGSGFGFRRPINDGSTGSGFGTLPKRGDTVLGTVKSFLKS
jgi:hypothetical protein